MRIRDFHNDGFAVLERVFNEDECKLLLDSIAVAEATPGARNLFTNPAVKTLANDPRLISIARDALGSDPLPFKAILFDKSEETNWLVMWHQDRVLPLQTRFPDPEWGPWTVKNGVNFAQAPTWAMERIVALRIHIDDSTFENGPLRVIPKSHKFGVLDQSDVVATAKSARHQTCTVGKGGVIALSPLLIHASSKSTSKEPRRVLHIEYATTLSMSEGIELALS